MRPADRIVALTLDAQRRIFRLAERDYGQSLKTISADSNIPYDTLRSYARREDTAMMPISAVVKLADVVPDHLLSHLFDPVGRHIVANDGEDGDLALLGREAAGFVSEYVEATSDGKVTPIERNRLCTRAGRLSNAAGRVAAA